MRWMIRVWTVVFCFWALPSQAAVLDPWAFRSLGTLTAENHHQYRYAGLTGGVLQRHARSGLWRRHLYISRRYLHQSLNLRDAHIGLAVEGEHCIHGTIDLRGTIDAGSRPLEVIAAENITLFSCSPLALRRLGL